MLSCRIELDWHISIPIYYRQKQGARRINTLLFYTFTRILAR
jgi:hypothetical protein